MSHDNMDARHDICFELNSDFVLRAIDIFTLARCGFLSKVLEAIQRLCHQTMLLDGMLFKQMTFAEEKRADIVDHCVASRTVFFRAVNATRLGSWSPLSYQWLQIDEAHQNSFALGHVSGSL